MLNDVKKKFPGVLLGSLLVYGCASAPTQPAVSMRSIDGYPAFECSDVQSELIAVGSWQQYQSNMQDYQKDQAESMKMWDGLGSIMGAVASQYDPTSQSTFQAMSQSNAVSTAHVETAAQEAAEHAVGMGKRRAVLERMLVLKGC
jgi:hypothetical protein